MQLFLILSKHLLPPHFSVHEGQSQEEGKIFLVYVSKDLCQDFLCTPRTEAWSSFLSKFSSSALHFGMLRFREKVSSVCRPSLPHIASFLIDPDVEQKLRQFILWRGFLVHTSVLGYIKCCGHMIHLSFCSCAESA